MRHALLLRSVARFLDDGESLIDAAYMWRRHRHMLWYGAAAFAALVVVAVGVGWREWPTIFGIGAAGSATAIYATTDYRVLARTNRRLIVLTASKIRQSARQLKQSYPAGTEIRLEDGNMLATTWGLEGESYTVPKSSERSMRLIASY